MGSPAFQARSHLGYLCSMKAQASSIFYLLQHLNPRGSVCFSVVASFAKCHPNFEVLPEGQGCEHVVQIKCMARCNKSLYNTV